MTYSVYFSRPPWALRGPSANFNRSIRGGLLFMPSRVSRTKKNRLIRDSDGRCWYCGRETVPQRMDEWGRCVIDGLTAAIDHVTPRSKGGGNEDSNLVFCCFSCNSQKASMSLEEYRLNILRMRGGLFTEEQIQYWESRGIELPIVLGGDFPIF